MEDNVIYMDNAATTPLRKQVLEAMLPYFTEKFANPSGIYRKAAECRQDVARARELLADSIHTAAENIYFTAGGSESDNWAIKAAAEAYGSQGRHIITTKIEHHAVLHTCGYLEKQGFEVTYLDVDENGLVDVGQLEAAIRPDTILISVMFANNEIGTIEPVEKIGQIARKHGVLFHTDAVQAYTQVPIDVEEMNIDMMSVSGHKIYGPKGIGFLYIRKGVKIRSFLHGGAQERHRRAGTENVAGIIGLARAAQLALLDREERTARECKIRDHIIERIEREIPFAILNGDRTKRLPGNVNFSFQYIEGESMLILLDGRGICASSGSACTSGSLDPSHVLLAIGLAHETAHGSLRITLGMHNTMEEADYLVDNLKEIVARLRDMSPLYADMVKKVS